MAESNVATDKGADEAAYLKARALFEEERKEQRDERAALAKLRDNLVEPKVAFTDSGLKGRVKSKGKSAAASETAPVLQETNGHNAAINETSITEGKVPMDNAVPETSPPVNADVNSDKPSYAEMVAQKERLIAEIEKLGGTITPYPGKLVVEDPEFDEYAAVHLGNIQQVNQKLEEARDAFIARRAAKENTPAQAPVPEEITAPVVINSGEKTENIIPSTEVPQAISHQETPSEEAKMATNNTASENISNATGEAILASPPDAAAAQKEHLIAEIKALGGKIDSWPGKLIVEDPAFDEMAAVKLGNPQQENEQLEKIRDEFKARRPSNESVSTIESVGTPAIPETPTLGEAAAVAAIPVVSNIGHSLLADNANETGDSAAHKEHAAQEDHPEEDVFPKAKRSMPRKPRNPASPKKGESAMTMSVEELIELGVTPERAEKLAYGQELQAQREKAELSRQELATAIQERYSSAEESLEASRAHEIDAQKVMRWERGRELPSRDVYEVIRQVMIDENEHFDAEQKEELKTRLDRAYAASEKGFKILREEGKDTDEKYALADTLIYIKARANLDEDELSERITQKLSDKKPLDVEEPDNLLKDREKLAKYQMLVETGDIIPSQGYLAAVFDLINAPEEIRGKAQVFYKKSAADAETQPGGAVADSLSTDRGLPDKATSPEETSEQDPAAARRALQLKIRDYFKNERGDNLGDTAIERLAEGAIAKSGITQLFYNRDQGHARISQDRARAMAEPLANAYIKNEASKGRKGSDVEKEAEALRADVLAYADIIPIARGVSVQKSREESENDLSAQMHALQSKIRSFFKDEEGNNLSVPAIGTLLEGDFSASSLQQLLYNKNPDTFRVAESRVRAEADTFAEAYIKHEMAKGRKAKQVKEEAKEVAATLHELADVLASRDIKTGAGTEASVPEDTTTRSIPASRRKIFESSPSGQDPIKQAHELQRKLRCYYKDEDGNNIGADRISQLTDRRIPEGSLNELFYNKSPATLRLSDEYIRSAAEILAETYIKNEAKNGRKGREVKEEANELRATVFALADAVQEVKTTAEKTAQRSLGKHTQTEAARRMQTKGTASTPSQPRTPKTAGETPQSKLKKAQDDVLELFTDSEGSRISISQIAALSGGKLSRDDVQNRLSRSSGVPGAMRDSTFDRIKDGLETALKRNEKAERSLSASHLSVELKLGKLARRLEALNAALGESKAAESAAR